MERSLYYTKVQGEIATYEIIVCAFSENNARAIVEEYFETEVMEVRPCTLDDIKNISDKRIMHASHIMTPMSELWLKTI